MYVGFAGAKTDLLNRWQQLLLIFRGDLHRVQHPATPTIKAEEQAPFTRFTGGVNMQRITGVHGRTQCRGMASMECFKILQEPITQLRDRASRENDPVLKA